MKVSMAVVFKMVLIRKNEFTDYCSTRQGMNTPWFRMTFSCDDYRNILYVFHILDKTIFPAKNDSSYRPSVRLRL